MDRQMPCILSILIALVLFSAVLPADGEEILFQAQDPPGDDTGDGDYIYPTHPSFGAGGQADLLGCTISRDQGHLLVELRLRDLVDPWQVGNRLTFVAIAVDTAEGGQEMLGHNAGACLECPAELQIFLAGDTCEIIDDQWNTLTTGAICQVDNQKEVMHCSIPLADIGTPSAAWKYTIAAGLQDDYGAGGLGDFRMVEAQPKEWRGGGGIDELDIDPNIYDLILPEALQKSLPTLQERKSLQESILGSYDLDKGKYVHLPSAN